MEITLYTNAFQLMLNKLPHGMTDYRNIDQQSLCLRWPMVNVYEEERGEQNEFHHQIQFFHQDVQQKAAKVVYTR